MSWAERFGPFLFFLACVLLTTCALMAEEPPRALVSALLTVETGSSLRPDGSVYYRNRADGAAGEVGCTQIGRMVVRQWHLDRNRLRTDTAYALAATVRHLNWLHRQLGTWDLAAAWNGGIMGRNRPSARAYARRVAAL